MTGELVGRVVLVTGGSRGIGRAIVHSAAAQGARVAFCARKVEQEAKTVVAEVEQAYGAPALAIAADVASEGAVDAMFDLVTERLGPVDVVVNNAAISFDRLVVSTSLSQWDATVACNLTGPFLVARRAVTSFLGRNASGRIINIGSLMAEGAPSNAAYAASKGGLVGLTRALATAHGGDRITTNLVVAGFVETALTAALPERARRALIDACPERRAAKADEVANTVLFLCSPRAANINGQILRVSGGLVEVPPYL